MKNDNYFEDDAPKNQVGDDAGMPEGSEPRGQGEDGEGEGETFMVNKEAYPEAKPGDTFMMRVERVHEGEMECSVEKPEEDEEHGEGEEAMAGAEAPPDSMMD